MKVEIEYVEEEMKRKLKKNALVGNSKEEISLLDIKNYEELRFINDLDELGDTSYENDEQALCKHQLANVEVQMPTRFEDVNFIPLVLQEILNLRPSIWKFQAQTTGPPRRHSVTPERSVNRAYVIHYRQPAHRRNRLPLI
ncbi:hypothetical protein H5410_008821 [Solanum commersonii]|uniref:Uncharacterized protein n=1 Tax=Solanum commersonii TaxID=4109 RepID=A0A9J6AGX4_SOLCO|nr:hypothetical protein H5410_008821 [Solanum commersonii]